MKNYNGTIITNLNVDVMTVDVLTNYYVIFKKREYLSKYNTFKSGIHLKVEYI